MTKVEVNQIQLLQSQGLGYRRIAAALNLPVNSVKSYCQRHPVTAVVPVDGFCKQCSRPISFLPGKKKKQFCCDRCRSTWWNHHRSEVERKTFHQLVCQQCGQPFSVYGKPDQKYCSRSCFAAARKKVAV